MKRFLSLCLFLMIILALTISPDTSASPAFSPRTETYVNVSSLTTPFDITVTKPTGTANGDILFCWIGWYAAVTIDSVPSGWALLGEYLANTDRYALYYKIASGEGASWVWSFTATAKVRTVCSCYTGGDFKASDPINVVSNTAYRTSDLNVIAATMAVASVNSPLIFWGGFYSTTTKSFTKPSVPTSGWVEDDDYWHTTADFGVEVCSMVWSGSGATGAMSATLSTGSIATKHAFAVALKPAAKYTTSEKLNLYESRTRLGTFSRSSSDLLSLFESSSRWVGLSFSLLQKLDLFSGIARQIGLSFTKADILNLFSTISRQIGFSFACPDSLNLQSAINKLASVSRAVSDFLSLLGSAVSQISVSKSVGDLLTLGSGVSFNLGIIRSQSDVLNLYAQPSRQINILRSKDDLLNLYASPSRQVSLSFVKLDQLNLYASPVKVSQKRGTFDYQWFVSDVLRMFNTVTFLTPPIPDPQPDPQPSGITPFYLAVVFEHWYQGSPMINVTVRLTRYGSNETFMAVTNEEGWVDFGNLPADYYQVDIPAFGLSFSMYHQTDETVRIDYGFWDWLSDGFVYASTITFARIPLWILAVIAMAVAAIYLLMSRSA